MRLGSIEFINSLPVDLGLTSGAVRLGGEILRGVPRQLNEELLRGRLDISPISAFWYAQHQDKFLILPHLSISSESSVDSVLLFSRCAVKDLKNKKIINFSHGQTTPVLLDILCRERYGFKPVLENVPEGRFDKNTHAFLVIGDMALKAKVSLAKENLHVLDLAEEWQKWTGLPIVFALWAVRRVFFHTEPGETFKTYVSIQSSKKWGLSHMDTILKFSERKTGLKRELLNAYFSKLGYDLSARHRKGMELFFSYAHKHGFLDKAVILNEVNFEKGWAHEHRQPA